jgi:hypothetical protein
VAITIGSCEGCSKTDITGYVACAQKRLCPVCSAPLLGVPEHDIRQFSEAQLLHTHGQDSPSPKVLSIISLGSAGFEPTTNRL